MVDTCALGKVVGDSHSTMIEAAMATPSSFKKGGTVKKTGLAKVHKGERVIAKKVNSRRSSRR